jgi:hypothetical protein
MNSTPAASKARRIRTSFATDSFNACLFANYHTGFEYMTAVVAQWTEIYPLPRLPLTFCRAYLG